MDMFSTAVLIVLVVSGLAWLRIKKAAKAVAENPQARETAKRIGAGLLSRLFNR
jgi:hypothetical protein